jgi:hypothetical protein
MPPPRGSPVRPAPGKHPVDLSRRLDELFGECESLLEKPLHVRVKLKGSRTKADKGRLWRDQFDGKQSVDARLKQVRLESHVVAQGAELDPIKPTPAPTPAVQPQLSPSRGPKRPYHELAEAVRKLPRPLSTMLSRTELKPRKARPLPSASYLRPSKTPPEVSVTQRVVPEWEQLQYRFVLSRPNTAALASTRERQSSSQSPTKDVDEFVVSGTGRSLPPLSSPFAVDESDARRGAFFHTLGTGERSEVNVGTAGRDTKDTNMDWGVIQPAWVVSVASARLLSPPLPRVGSTLRIDNSKCRRTSRDVVTNRPFTSPHGPMHKRGTRLELPDIVATVASPTSLRSPTAATPYFPDSREASPVERRRRFTAFPSEEEPSTPSVGEVDFDDDVRIAAPRFEQAAPDLPRPASFSRLQETTSRVFHRLRNTGGAGNMLACESTDQSVIREQQSEASRTIRRLRERGASEDPRGEWAPGHMSPVKKEAQRIRKKREDAWSRHLVRVRRCLTTAVVGDHPHSNS